MNELVVIVTANFAAAVDEWRDRMKELHHASLRGVLTDGRPFRIVSIDNVEQVRGLQPTDCAFHASTWGHRHYRKVSDMLNAQVQRTLDMRV